MKEKAARPGNKSKKQQKGGGGIQKRPKFKPNTFLKNKGKKGNQKKSITSQLITHAEEQRLERIREQSERKAVKEAQILQKKKEKKRKLKMLAKKNSRGQPIMKGRMQLLLEKIEKRMG